jgi:hypothetical protein
MLLTITFPLYLFIIGYAALAIFVAIFIAINIYHIIINAALSTVSSLVSGAIIIACVAIMFFTYSLLSGTNWNTPIVEIEVPSPSDLFNQQSTF